MIISDKFPKYQEYDPLVPVWCVTPNEGRCIHRFFDTSPFSPSQRYMAVLRLPQETRLPDPGEKAQVVLIDLHEGTENIIAETIGWEPQMGANINWGATDYELYFNDVDPVTWEPFCTKLNPITGEKKRLSGTVYRISPDGKNIISACMKRMRRTQYGYGVVVPDEYVPRNFGFCTDDGLYITDTNTGECRIIVSISEIAEKTGIDKEKYKNIECYGFHCKYNPQGDRIMFSMRGFEKTEHEPWDMLFSSNMHYWIITLKPDGSDIHIAVGPEEWYKGGHHTTWQPDGKRLSMNLAVDGNGRLYFMQVDYNGENYQKIHDTLIGSGHPTLHPNGRHILTDTYEQERVAFGDGTVPLRFIDIKTGEEKTAVRINIRTPAAEKVTALRVDPHPAWSPDYRYAAFNGFVNGTRRVFIADFKDLLE